MLMKSSEKRFLRRPFITRVYKSKIIPAVKKEPGHLVSYSNKFMSSDVSMV